MEEASKPASRLVGWQASKQQASNQAGRTGRQAGGGGLVDDLDRMAGKLLGGRTSGKGRKKEDNER
jgi:hypothetical protein